MASVASLSFKRKHTIPVVLQVLSELPGDSHFASNSAPGEMETCPWSDDRMAATSNTLLRRYVNPNEDFVLVLVERALLRTLSQRATERAFHQGISRAKPLAC